MNPYAPPTTDVGMAAPARRRLVAFLVLGLSVLQLVAMAMLMYGYLELVRTGAISYVTTLSGFIGCGLLYVGAVRFAWNAARGGRLFVAAFVLLLWAIRGWELRYLWSYPYVLGAAICVLGWWFSRRGAASERNAG